MVKLSTISLSCMISISIVTTSLAVPVCQTDPPGQPPTTYQKWTFDDADNPALPELVANSYGMPKAEILGKPDYTFGWYETYNGRTGVWHAEYLSLALTIPNRQILDGYKEIWVDMVFQGGLDTASVSLIPPGTAVIPLGETITELENHWKRLEIGWRLVPNPYSEIVCLGLSGTGGSIDYVIANTICIPEPATFTLFGLGAVALLNWRKPR